MIVYLSVAQVLEVHRRQVKRFGGATALRDRGALESAVARPAATFGGEDLYPDLAAKAAALLHSVVANHPFADGNKRTGAAAAELFLMVNGHELVAADADLENIVMTVARGEVQGEELAIWLRQRMAAAG